jgi:hypothetical protein
VAKKHTNLPAESLRWSVPAIVREFNVNRQTLIKQLADAGITPAEDGCFSTVQILNSFIGGDIKSQRLEEGKARTELIRLKSGELRGDVVRLEDIKRPLESAFAFIRQEILGNSDLSDQSKKSLLSHLSDFKLPKSA